MEGESLAIVAFNLIEKKGERGVTKINSVFRFDGRLRFMMKEGLPNREGIDTIIKIIAEGAMITIEALAKESGVNIGAETGKLIRLIEDKLIDKDRKIKDVKYHGRE